MTSPRKPSRGDALTEKGDLAGALADYTEAIRLKPDYIYAYTRRGHVLKEKGDLAGALADYTDAIRLKPDDVDAYITGPCCTENRKIARARSRISRSTLHSEAGAVTAIKRKSKGHPRTENAWRRAVTCYFDAAMERLRNNDLNVSLDAVQHPASRPRWPRRGQSSSKRRLGPRRCISTC